MYEESESFDPSGTTSTNDALICNQQQPLLMAAAAAGSTTHSHSGFDENSSRPFSMEHHHHHHHQHLNIEMEIELQQHLNIDNSNGEINNNTSHHQQADIHHDDLAIANQVLSFADEPEPHIWDPSSVHDQVQQMHQVVDDQMQIGHHHNYAPNYPPPPDLLNLFNMPRCSAAASSFLQNSSISCAAAGDPTGQTNPMNMHNNTLSFLGEISATTTDCATGSSVLYDPLYHLNLPPQPPLFRELFQSLPHGYNLPSRVGSLFGGVDETEEMTGGGGGGGLFNDGENGVLEFAAEMGGMGRGRDGNSKKHFATERQRRENFNDKYKALRNLIPNPTKTDRASIVEDAIKYIKELIRTVNELKILVEKKRCGRERMKRQKMDEEDGAEGDVESTDMKPQVPADQSYNNGSLRSSWLQRKSKDTEVDVRIIDDDVTIKLVQRKKINCLILVSKILDELQLDLHHVAGGNIGDFYSFLFNTKIHEGSSVYASAIANKLIEVVDRQYAGAIPQTTSSF